MNEQAIELLKILASSSPLLFALLVLIVIIYAAPLAVFTFCVVQMKTALTDISTKFEESLNRVTDELKELREIVSDLIHHK